MIKKSETYDLSDPREAYRFDSAIQSVVGRFFDAMKTEIRKGGGRVGVVSEDWENLKIVIKCPKRAPENPFSMATRGGDP